MELYRGQVQGGRELAYELKQDRFAWIQVVKGDLDVNGTGLEAGDGAAIESEFLLQFSTVDGSEFLLFDLA